MLGHKKDTKNTHYLGSKSDSQSKFTLGNKDFLSQSSQNIIKHQSGSHNGILNNSNSKDAQIEPLKRTRF